MAAGLARPVEDGASLGFSAGVVLYGRRVAITPAWSEA